MKDNSTLTLAPKLRFPEFRNTPEWEEVTLGRVLTEHGEKSDGASEVHSVSVHKGVINQVEHLGRSFASANRSNYNLAKPHDIIYTKSPTGDFPFGIVKQNRLPYNVIVSPLYGVFSPINRHVGYIIDAYFESPIRANNYLAPITQKGAKNTIQISNVTFLSKGLYLPNIEAEQQKIADCLTSLDELLAAEGWKLEALRAHKQGLMQRLFPREGETVPRLRFPDFRDAPDWMHGRCSDIAIVLQGYGFPERHQGQTEGKYPFYKVSDISRVAEQDLRFIDQANNYVEEAVVHELKAKPVPSGTTVFAKIGEAIRLNRRAIITAPALIDNNTAGVKAIDGVVSDEFLFYLWTTIPLIESAGGVVPAVSKTAIENFSVSYPRITNEQAKIVACLSSLDTQIGAQAKKLGVLKSRKNGLMQQLFPSPDEVVT